MASKALTEFVQGQKTSRTEQAGKPKVTSLEEFRKKRASFSQPGVTLPGAPGEDTQSPLGGFAKGIGKGALSTLRGASALGEKGIKALGRTVTPKALEKPLGFEREETTAAERLIPEEAVTPETPAEKVGFFTEQVGEFFLPSGIAAKALKAGKAGKVAKVARVAGAEAGITTAVTAAQRGAEEDVSREALTAGAVAAVGVPALGAAGNLAKRFFGSFSKNLAGVVTGKGAEVVERVFADPKVAKVGLRGEDVTIVKQLAQKAKTATVDLKKRSNANYARIIDSLPDTPVSDKKTIFNTIVEPLGALGVKVKGNVLNFEASPLTEAEERLVNRMVNIVKSQTNFSPKALNTLAVKIGKFRKTGLDVAQFNKIVDSTKRNIRNSLGDQVSEANASFAKTEDFLEALSDAIRVSPAGRVSTKELNKIGKKIQTLFSGNKELARDLVDELSPEIATVEAGRQLGQPVSRSAASIGDALRSAIQTVIPPRAVGEIVAATGIASQKVKPFMDALGKLLPAERVTIISILQGLREEE